MRILIVISFQFTWVMAHGTYFPARSLDVSYHKSVLRLSNCPQISWKLDHSKQYRNVCHCIVSMTVVRLFKIANHPQLKKKIYQIVRQHMDRIQIHCVVKVVTVFFTFLRAEQNFRFVYKSFRYSIHLLNSKRSNEIHKIRKLKFFNSVLSLIRLFFLRECIISAKSKIHTNDTR